MSQISSGNGLGEGAREKAGRKHEAAHVFSASAVAFVHVSPRLLRFESFETQLLRPNDTLAGTGVRRRGPECAANDARHAAPRLSSPARHALRARFAPAAMSGAGDRYKKRQREVGPVSVDRSGPVADAG